MVLDAVDYGTKNIISLTGKTIAAPPVPVRSFRKQKNKPKSHVPDFYTTIEVNDIVKVFEVWRVILDDEQQTDVYMVIAANCTMQGYRKAKWSNVSYKGFYSTVDEAKHYIYTEVG